MQAARSAVGLQGLLTQVLRVTAVWSPAVLRDEALQPEEGALALQREVVEGLLPQFQDAGAVLEVPLALRVVPQRPQGPRIPQPCVVEPRLERERNQPGGDVLAAREGVDGAVAADEGGLVEGNLVVPHDLARHRLEADPDLAGWRHVGQGRRVGASRRRATLVGKQRPILAAPTLGRLLLAGSVR